jgi:hypothetical protein
MIELLYNLGSHMKTGLQRYIAKAAAENNGYLSKTAMRQRCRTGGPGHDQPLPLAPTLSSE